MRRPPSRPAEPDDLPALAVFGSLVPCEVVRSLPEEAARREIEEVARSIERVLACGRVEGVSDGRATTKGTTFRFRVGRRALFAKRHRVHSSYEAEISCYRLLATSSLVPELVGFDDHHRLLVTRCVEEPQAAGDPGSVLWHFCALGRIHGIWERACESGEAFHLALPRADADDAIEESERAIILAFAENMPRSWVPLSLADVKVEHVVGSGVGRRLIDFEQAATGRFDLVDVVMLAAQVPPDGFAVEVALASYDAGRRGTGSRAPSIAPCASLFHGLVDRAASWIRDLNAALLLRPPPRGNG